MKRSVTIISMVLIAGSLASGALAGDGVLSKDELKPGSYCHMKFPAIQPRTLSSDSPQLKSPTAGDVIDFYGPCDESPTGADQVTQQKHDEEFGFRKRYQDSE